MFVTSISLTVCKR